MFHWRDGWMDMLNPNHWFGWLKLTGSTPIGIGAAIAFCGLDKIIQTLPSITPRVVSGASSKTRLGNRDELWRARFS